MLSLPVLFVNAGRLLQSQASIPNHASAASAPGAAASETHTLTVTQHYSPPVAESSEGRREQHHRGAPWHAVPTTVPQLRVRRWLHWTFAGATAASVR